MVAKIIKQEAKAEKAALEQAVRELAELQRTQKYAVKVRNGVFTVYSNDDTEPYIDRKKQRPAQRMVKHYAPSTRRNLLSSPPRLVLKELRLTYR